MHIKQHVRCFEACLLICFIACFQPCLDITCTKSSLLFSPSVKSMEFHTKWKPSPNPSLTLWSKYGPHINSFTGISLDWTVWKNHVGSPKKDGWNVINIFKDKSYILFQIKVIGQTYYDCALMENVHWWQTKLFSQTTNAMQLHGILYQKSRNHSS